MASRAFVAILLTGLVVPSLAAALKLPDLPGVDPVATGEVTIQRDAYGVPHVFADDAYSLFWGNGYVMAQDRLFQMDVLRHVGKGESAAYLGPAQLEMDLATRRELYTDAERTERWNSLPEDQREMFQGFADGVNAWIEKTRREPLLLSAEFYAIAHTPEDWVAEDTIAIAEYLLDIFGAGSGGGELDNARLLVQLRETLGDDAAEGAFRDFFWMHDAETYTSIDPAAYTYAATEGPLDFADIPADQWALVEAAAGAVPFAGGKSLVEAAQAAGMPTKFGSNALIVAPELMADGNAALIGGPQMAYYNPMIPYEVALHGAGFDALGMGVGGAPGVIIGRNPHFAWTVTSGSSDQVDVVAVKLVDGFARRYFLEGLAGEERDMECRDEIHYGLPTAIDSNPPKLATQEICRTVYGPVFAINEDAGYAFVRQRTHRGDELRSGILWLTLGQAQTLQQFQDHMETFRFEFNFHVAADNGDIAYFHWGANPVRDPRCDPRLPRLAGMCDWDGFLTGSDLPHIVNPERGYVANWNNKPAMGWSSGDSMEKWGPVHRAELLDAAVQKRIANGPLTTQDLKDINVEISTRSPFPPDFVPFVLDATASRDDEVVQAARAALAAWAETGFGWDDADEDGLYDSPGFAIYETWRGLIQERVFRDELGPHVRVMGFDPPLTSDPHAGDHGREDNKDNTLFNAFRGATSADWCDNVVTDAVESCADVAAAAFEEAVAALTLQYSDDVGEWNQPVRQIKFVSLSGGPSWLIPMVNRPSFNHFYNWGTGETGSVLPPGANQYWEPIDFALWQAMGAPQDQMPDAHKRDQLDLYTAFEWKPANMVPASPASTQTIVIR